MKSFELPINKCPLCELNNIGSIPSIGNARTKLYNCPNCGPFKIGIMAYRFTPIIINSEIRQKLSYYIRHNSSEEKPLNVTKDSFEEILKSVKLPTTLEQLDQILLWFGKKSQFSFRTVDGHTSQLIAYLGCRVQRDVIELLDQLWNEKYIEMEVPTTGSLRERPVFDSFCGHLTKEGLLKINEIQQKHSLINFPLNLLSVDDILRQRETSVTEIKGSCKLDLNRLLKGDGKKVLEKQIAQAGILKEIVAYLNAKGGVILIGVLEKDKFSAEEIKKISNTEESDYYIIGINNEETNIDNYQLTLHDLISSHISKELVELIEISFPQFKGYTLCEIVINKASHKWYYLDNDKFYVRIGNKTEILSGNDADLYKKRNPR